MLWKRLAQARSRGMPPHSAEVGCTGAQAWNCVRLVRKTDSASLKASVQAGLVWTADNPLGSWQAGMVDRGPRSEEPASGTTGSGCQLTAHLGRRPHGGSAPEHQEARPPAPSPP